MSQGDDNHNQTDEHAAEPEVVAQEEPTVGSTSSLPSEPPEESAGSLPQDPELEKALREAAEAVEAHEASRKKGSTGSAVIAVTREEHDRVLGDLEKAKAEHEETRKELDDLKERSLRLQADFDNLRKRTLKERQDAHQYGHEGLVRDLLGTVDNLERALDHAKTNEDVDLKGIVQGVELVQRELLGALSTHAVNVIEAEGQPFDPNVHEAMAQAESDEVAPGTIMQVLQSGYQLRDRLLRPSRVVVSRKPEAELTEETEDQAES